MSADPSERSPDDGPTDSAGILAHVDGFRAGVFDGWAFDPARPDAPVTVQLFAGHELVAEGLADRYRADLEEAGVGGGRHAFRLRLLKPLAAGESHRIAMLCNGNLKPVRFSGFTVRMTLEWRARILALEGRWVLGEFSREVDSPTTLQGVMCVDGEPVDTFTSGYDEAGGRYAFRCLLPERVFDGRPHLISVSIEGDACEASIVEVLRPISTPWQYLATGAGATGQVYAGLPAQVSRRLAAFERRIGELKVRGVAVETKNVWQALQVLNEGHENRLRFPGLKLPAVPRGTKPEVSILIPVRDHFALTYHCIASLILAPIACTYEVIVIDDSSVDETLRIGEIVRNVRVLRNPDNLGFVRSCNKAARSARGRYLVLLNNDTEVSDRWLDEMLDVFRRFERVGVVGAKLINPDGTLQEAGGIVWDDGTPWNLGRGDSPFHPQWNYARQVDYVSGAALMVSRAVWDVVGGLSDAYAPAYYEDTDLAFKVRAAGYRTFYTPHAEVVHMEGMSHGNDASAGLKRHQALNAPRFRESWAQAYIHNGSVGVDLWRQKDREIRRRALVIDYATPQPDKDAGSFAAIQEMRLLQSHGFKLTFLPENLAHFGRYTADLQRMGVECMHAPFCLSVEEFLQRRGHEFDLVFITRYGVAEAQIESIRRHTRARVLLNVADLHFLREFRSNLASGNRDFTGPIETRERELSVMRKVDAILSYSDSEHAVILSHNARGDNLFKCPWVVDGRGHRTPFAERDGIAFLGSYRHPPNVEAVAFLAERVMPLLRATGRKITVRIHGSHVPQAFNEWAAEDFVIAGYAEDLDEVFERCRVFVAPLQSGAGIKGKVLEAMSRAVPMVLSPLAAEATGLADGITASIAESPQEWVAAILDLYDDQLKWQAYSDASLALARRNHSFDAGRDLLGRALGYLGFFSGPKAMHAVATHPLNLERVG